LVHRLVHNVSWYIKWFFGTLGLVIFGTFCAVFTFGTPVAFGALRIGSVFSTLGIIPHLASFGTLVALLYILHCTS